MQESENLTTTQNKRKQAVALTYDTEKNNAPVVVAAGSGLIADKIIEIAEESGVSVYRDDTAATLLSQLQLGREIPFELYEVVAQVFAYVMETAKEIKKPHKEMKLEERQEKNKGI